MKYISSSLSGKGASLVFDLLGGLFSLFILEGGLSSQGLGLNQEEMWYMQKNNNNEIIIMIIIIIIIKS